MRYLVSEEETMIKEVRDTDELRILKSTDGDDDIDGDFSHSPWTFDVLNHDDPSGVAMTFSSWATPTVKRIAATRHTPRTLRLLGNQVYHSRQTWEYVTRCHPNENCDNPWKVHYHFRINPEFTEALMGYPKGWTDTVDDGRHNMRVASPLERGVSARMSYESWYEDNKVWIDDINSCDD
jgi:hypothetical protein